MALRLINRGNPLTEAEVRELEELAGIGLPAEYRAFLMTHNGGTFDGEVVCDVVGLSGETRGFDRFHTVIRLANGRLNELREPPESPETPTEGVILGIGVGQGGNFYIGCYGEESGRVYFVWGDHGVSDWCHLVAYSFTEFLANIRAK